MQQVPTQMALSLAAASAPTATASAAAEATASDILPEERALVLLPQHSGALKGFSLRYPVFSRAVQLGQPLPAWLPAAVTRTRCS